MTFWDKLGVDRYVLTIWNKIFGFLRNRQKAVYIIKFDLTIYTLEVVRGIVDAFAQKCRPKKHNA